MLNAARICLAACLLSLALLVTGLPFRSGTTTGVAATLGFCALNPPALLARLVTYRDVREFETSAMQRWEYPIMAALSIGWWSGVEFLLRGRRRRE